MEEDVEKAGYSEIEVHVGGRDCRDLADFPVGTLEERDADDVGTVVKYSLGEPEDTTRRSMEFYTLDNRIILPARTSNLLFLRGN